MATTSLWRVNGWLGKVLIYVENPDKTDNPAFYEAGEMTERELQGLSDVIGYATDSRKTSAGTSEQTGNIKQFITGINCHAETARDEMIAVKKRFGKESGTAAYHGYQSFAPGEATPETAHEIGVELARRLWGERYQVIVATHLDKAHHLHNHFVLNTVSFLDGKKYHRTEKDYRDMRRTSDELCRAYGLSVVEQPEKKAKHYGEWRAEKEGRPTWRGIVKADVDEALRTSMTETQFYAALRRKGYEIKTGRNISVRPPGKERFVRLARNFGEDYTPDGIRRRILGQTRTTGVMQRDSHPYHTEAHGRMKSGIHSIHATDRISLYGNQTQAKTTGFRALYFHYCYLLGVFPERKPPDNRRMHFLLREDLIKLDMISEEARLLAREKIDTAGQLSSYKESLKTRITETVSTRTALYRKKRTATVRTDEEQLREIKTEISTLTKELSSLRREVKLCDDIAVRSGIMAEKLERMRQGEQRKRKEETQHEQFRRRGGTGRADQP